MQCTESNSKALFCGKQSILALAKHLSTGKGKTMNSDNSELPLFGKNIDPNQIPPLHEKRMIAFVNAFVTQVVSFMNSLAVQCETKFSELENKIQKTETCLRILEVKLASISGIDQETGSSINVSKLAGDAAGSEQKAQIDETIAEDVLQVESESFKEAERDGIRAKDDARYRKYFKMIQFGVPSEAVKMKMDSEGIDASILDNPDRILTDGVPYEAPEDA